MVGEPDRQATLTHRERQGPGARYDSPAAPARDLLNARRGTAYFARLLNDLSDAELEAPSRIAGWSRRHVIAHVSYHARGLARLAEAARAGHPMEALTEPAAQSEDVALGATLPAHALRHLFRHSEVHLNVEWRDLDATAWSAVVQTLGGVRVALRDTPAIRAAEIWRRALDLRCGGSGADLPPELR